MIESCGGSVRLQGSIDIVEMDFIAIIMAMREKLKERMGEDAADAEINECINLAFVSEEELNEKLENALHALRESIVEDFLKIHSRREDA